MTMNAFSEAIIDSLELVKEYAGSKMTDKTMVIIQEKF
jgi:hypothetical protein